MADMKWHMTKIARRDLDRQLERVREAVISPPLKGWIRAIRDSLGMTAAQLAGRLGIKAPSVTEIEQREASGAVTLGTLRKVAEALDCKFVYALVPIQTLDATLRRQAMRVAAKRLKQVGQTMDLEAQGLSKEDNQAQYEELVETLIRESPRELWAER